MSYTETEVSFFLRFDFQLLSTAFTHEVFHVSKSHEREKVGQRDGEMKMNSKE
jgi:hypothetical protein